MAIDFNWETISDGLSDWGSTIGNEASTNIANDDSWFSGLTSSGGGDTGFWGNIWSGVKGLFGGGDQEAGASNVFGAMLGGLGTAAGAMLDEKTAKELGTQQRKNLEFKSQLDDFYGQKEKARKRVALDTYGQFSLIGRYAPGAVNTPPVEVPTKPTA